MRTFYAACQWVDHFIPIELSPLPAIPSRQVITFIPAHPPLVLPVMDRKNRWYCGHMPVCKTILHHKWNKPRMMIVHMDHIRLMLPITDPVNYCYLKSGETFRIIIITVDLFAIEQTIDIHAIQIEAEGIFFFLDNGIIKFMRPHAEMAFMV